MALYLLQRVGETPYDQTAGFVISASSSHHARTIAHDDDGYWYNMDDDHPWLDPERSTCRQLSYSSPEPYGVVLRDFRAG